jgi:hypothetical protein
VFNILLANTDTPTAPEWVFFGRVGIVVGIIAGLVGIIAGIATVVWFFRTVLPDLLKPLKVEFRILTFPPNRVLEDAFEFLGASRVEGILAELVSRSPGTFEHHLELDIVLGLVVEAIKARFADRLPPATGGFSRAITVVKVKNTGRQLQQNVTVSIAQANYFVIQTNNKWETQIAAGQVHLGAMQAQDEFEVCAWGSNPWDQSKEWLKVRSNQGPAAIKYRPWETQGSYIRRNVLYAIAIGIGIALVALPIGWALQHWWPL